MSALTLDWAAAADAGPALAGGKGWQLAMMARMGVPVPTVSCCRPRPAARAPTATCRRRRGRPCARRWRRAAG